MESYRTAVSGWSSGDDYTSKAQPSTLRLTAYDQKLILQSMRIGERGQVTIPNDIRDQFGLGPETEVQFHVVAGNIVLRKAAKKLNLAKWKGRCAGTFAKLGYSSVDKFIGDVRGR